MYKDNAFKFVGPENGGQINRIKNNALEAEYVNTPPQREKFPKGGDNRNKPVTSQPQKARVIVRQGDKRVPAAKSRPKKRKAVTPDDENTLSMDSIEWSSVTYNVTSLIRVYRDKFPLIVKVVHGYHGDIGTPLAIGQVLQIHSNGIQQRVLVTDSQDRKLSMPVDYPIELNVLEQNDRVWMKLRDLILSRTLPLRGRVMSVSKDAPKGVSRNFIGQDVNINGLKEDIFLRGNNINNGWLDQMDILHLPSFIEAQFVVAENMRGASGEEWRDYHGMYSRSVRHLDFSLMDGFSGIYLEGAIPTLLVEDESSHQSPTNTFNQPSTEQHDLYMNAPSHERTRDSSKNVFYDNHSFTNDNGGQDQLSPVSSPKDIIPHFENHDTYKSKPETKPNDISEASSVYDNNVSGPSGSFLVSPEIHARPETPFSDVEDDDVETMFDNVIKVGEETLEKQRREESERALSVHNSNQAGPSKDTSNILEKQRLLREEEMNRERKRKEEEANALRDSLKNDENLTLKHDHVFETEEQCRIRKEQEERERIAQDALRKREREESKRRSQRENELRAKQFVAMTTPALGDEIQLDENTVQYSNHIEMNNSRKHSSGRKDSVEEPAKESVLSILNKFQGSSTSLSSDGQQRSRPASRSGSRSGPRGSYISETSSGTPMGVIQPTILQRKESLKENLSRRKLSSSRAEGSDLPASKIKSMQDVPDRTSKLTVPDVCQCLKLLNMDVHIPEFKSNQIDGNSLGEMKETILMSEFHFTPFNASKLMRFSRGWRPNIA